MSFDEPSTVSNNYTPVMYPAGQSLSVLQHDSPRVQQIRLLKILKMANPVPF